MSEKLQGLTRRFVVLLGPGGYITCVPANSSWRRSRYRNWIVLCVIHRPISPELVRQTQLWAVRESSRLIKEGQ
jgi:hypothetical protein